LGREPRDSAVPRWLRVGLDRSVNADPRVRLTKALRWLNEGEERRDRLCRWRMRRRSTCGSG